MNHYNTLIVGGGGVLGFSFLGALHALLEEKAIDISKIEHFVGSSVGSIVALLVYIGYSPLFIFSVLVNVHFESTETLCTLNNFLEFPQKKGLLDVSILSNVLATFLEMENISINITFEELFQWKQKKTKTKIKKDEDDQERKDCADQVLYIAGLNITTGKTEIFSMTNSPEMPVLDAIKISVCVPILFRPVSYKNCYYVDGAFLDNSLFQQFFEQNLNNTVKLRAVLIESITEMPQLNNCKKNITTAHSPNFSNEESLIDVIQFVQQLFCCNSVHSRNLQRQLVDIFCERTNSFRISIPVTSATSSMNFVLSKNDRVEYFQNGLLAARNQWTSISKKAN